MAFKDVLGEVLGEGFEGDARQALIAEHDTELSVYETAAQTARDEAAEAQRKLDEARKTHADEVTALKLRNYEYMTQVGVTDPRKADPEFSKEDPDEKATFDTLFK